MERNGSDGPLRVLLACFESVPDGESCFSGVLLFPGASCKVFLRIQIPTLTLAGGIRLEYYVLMLNIVYASTQLVMCSSVACHWLLARTISFIIHCQELAFQAEHGLIADTPPSRYKSKSTVALIFKITMKGSALISSIIAIDSYKEN